jgi:integrase
MPRAAQNVLKRNAMAVKKAVARDAKPAEYRIDGVPGLVLLCQPTGAAKWYFYYSVRVGAKNQRRKLALGDRDSLSLADACRRVLELRNAVDAGADPVADAQDQAKGITFKEMAEEFIETDRLADSTKAVYRNSYETHVYPVIGDLPATQVTGDHIVRICRAIEKNGTLIQSDRTKSYIGGAFRYGLHQRYVKVNPTAGLGRRAKTAPRERTPSADEISEFYWHGPEKPGVPVSAPVRDIIRLAILTGQRRQECAGARVDEFDGLDGDAPTWTLPGDKFVKGRRTKGRTKNGRTQVVRLSRQAAELVRSAIEAHSDGEYLFPTNRSTVAVGKTPRTPHIHEHSVSTAIRRMRNTLGHEDIRLHDLRRGIANWMKDQGIGREVRDLILNHKDGSVDDLHYSNSATMERQVRAAMQAWGDHVESLVTKPEELSAAKGKMAEMPRTSSAHPRDKVVDTPERV